MSCINKIFILFNIKIKEGVLLIISFEIGKYKYIILEVCLCEFFLNLLIILCFLFYMVKELKNILKVFFVEVVI